MNLARRLCPSCQTRLSPLAVECPVCGLAFRPPERARRLLFDAEALQSPRAEAPAPTVIQAPALGRVGPVALAAPEPLPPLDEPAAPRLGAPEPLATLGQDSDASFWPLVRLEACEALLLLLLNLVAALLGAWVLHAPLARLFAETWMLVLPFHLALSWGVLMVPLVLSGRSPLMGRWNLMLAEEEPDRRMLFSLLHLASVLAFPLSFLCMVLSPRHQTLAEYLSGQEIISRPASRMR